MKAKVKKTPQKLKVERENLPTLRDICGRLKSQCDLLICDGVRYWSDSHIADYRYQITKNELNLIEYGEYEKHILYFFPLDQPVKVGKKSVKLVHDDIEIQFFSVFNLCVWDKEQLAFQK